MHLRPRVQSSKMSDTAEMVGQSGHESQQVKFVSDYQSSFNGGFTSLYYPASYLHPGAYEPPWREAPATPYI